MRASTTPMSVVPARPTTLLSMLQPSARRATVPSGWAAASLTLMRLRSMSGGGQAQGLGAARAGVDELTMPQLVDEQGPDHVRVVRLSARVATEQIADLLLAEVPAVAGGRVQQ